MGRYILFLYAWVEWRRIDERGERMKKSALFAIIVFLHCWLRTKRRARETAFEG
jgi:hypothetical protein